MKEFTFPKENNSSSVLYLFSCHAAAEQGSLKDLTDICGHQTRHFPPNTFL